MINRIFFISTLFISSLLLTQCSQPPRSSQPCDSGIPYFSDYMWRDENRCEGIIKKTYISGGIKLISLTTSVLTEFEEELQLHIPNFSKSNNVNVRSLAEGYQLDNIKSYKPEASVLTFSWSTYVLKQHEKITPNSLRALASYKVGSHNVFLPVTLGKKSSKEYKFVIYSDSTVENSTFVISRKDKSFHTCRLTTPERGEIICMWKPNKAPKGRYQLKYKFKLKPISKSLESKEDSISFKFEHNPAWLQ